MQATTIERGMRLAGARDARMAELAAWFDAEYEGLLRFAYLVSGDRHLAEDLVQEAFVKMSLSGARAGHTGIRAYARTTVVNLARSRFRRTLLERRSQARESYVPDHGDAVDSRDEVWQAMKALSPRQRAVVALRYYEDLSEAEIAATLGMSAGTVKQHADRAMRRLRDVIGRQS